MFLPPVGITVPDSTLFRFWGKLIPLVFCQKPTLETIPMEFFPPLCLAGGFGSGSCCTVFNYGGSGTCPSPWTGENIFWWAPTFLLPSPPLRPPRDFYPAEPAPSCSQTVAKSLGSGTKQLVPSFFWVLTASIFFLSPPGHSLQV